MENRFWDKVAGVYDLFVNIYNRQVHQQLKSYIGEQLNENDDVLECACGTGMLSEVIAGKCHKLTSTDFSRKMLEKAEKKCRNYNNCVFELADITDLKYEDESFDVVVAANVIHLLEDPLKALKEMSRVCKKGGRLIIPTYMNKEKTGQPSTFSQVVGKAGADFRHSFTRTSYRSFFEREGYVIKEAVCFDGRVPCAVVVIAR